MRDQLHGDAQAPLDNDLTAQAHLAHALSTPHRPPAARIATGMPTADRRLAPRVSVCTRSRCRPTYCLVPSCTCPLEVGDLTVGLTRAFDSRDDDGDEAGEDALAHADITGARYEMLVVLAPTRMSAQHPVRSPPGSGKSGVAASDSGNLDGMSRRVAACLCRDMTCA